MLILTVTLVLRLSEVTKSSVHSAKAHVSLYCVLQMVIFEVGDHPPAGVEIHGTIKLPYAANVTTFDKATLAAMKKSVEPFI